MEPAYRFREAVIPTFRGLFCEVFSITDCKASNIWVTDEWQIEKYLKRSGRGLGEVLSRFCLEWQEENHEISKSR
jgi:hypothetical protein